MTVRSHPLDRYLNTLGEGLVDWIGVRPRRREPLMAVPSVLAVADRGLEGDHRMAKTPGSGRQVTVIAAEFIDHIAPQMGVEALHPTARCDVVSQQQPHARVVVAPRGEVSVDGFKDIRLHGLLCILGVMQPVRPIERTLACLA